MRSAKCEMRNYSKCEVRPNFRISNFEFRISHFLLVYSARLNQPLSCRVTWNGNMQCGIELPACRLAPLRDPNLEAS
jgi:hypothetical protein